MKKLMCLGVMVAGALAARGDTYTVAEGETQTLDSVTNTTRFTKSGKGTRGTTTTRSWTRPTASRARSPLRRTGRGAGP